MEFGAGFELWDLNKNLLNSCILFATCIMIHGWNFGTCGLCWAVCRDTILHWAKFETGVQLLK
jgi:hypothetical protein